MNLSVLEPSSNSPLHTRSAEGWRRKNISPLPEPQQSHRAAGTGPRVQTTLLNHCLVRWFSPLGLFMGINSESNAFPLSDCDEWHYYSWLLTPFHRRRFYMPSPCSAPHAARGVVILPCPWTSGLSVTRLGSWNRRGVDWLPPHPPPTHTCKVSVRHIVEFCHLRCLNPGRKQMCGRSHRATAT